MEGFDDIEDFDGTGQSSSPGSQVASQQSVSQQSSSDTAEAPVKNQGEAAAAPEPDLNLDGSGSDDVDDTGLNLNLDLEEFIPDKENVDFDQYAEQIKETAQKGAKENLQEQVEDASEPSDIDLEGLKQDLTEEIRETAGDIAPPEKDEGIGRDFDDEPEKTTKDQDKSEEKEREQAETAQQSRKEQPKTKQKDARGPEGRQRVQEDRQKAKTNDVEREVTSGEDAGETDGSDLGLSRPSPPQLEDAQRYDEATDSLYVEQEACKRAFLDVQEVESTVDVLRDKLNSIDDDTAYTRRGKDVMGQIQEELLELENKLFKEEKG